MCSQSERNIQELESISTKNFYGNNCVRKRHYYSDPGTKNFLNASIGRNEFKSTNECKRRNFFSPYASPRPEKYFLKSKNFFDSKFNLNHIKKSCLITSEDLAPLINKSSTCKYYFYLFSSHFDSFSFFLPFYFSNSHRFVK